MASEPKTNSTPRELRAILAELRIAVEMIELSVRLHVQGGPSPGILREAMERLERIPPQLFDLLNRPDPDPQPQPHDGKEVGR